MRWYLGVVVFLIVHIMYAGDAIRVLTWNVLADRALKDRRIPELLRVVHAQKAHVIVFQETEGWFVKELQKTAWKKTYPFEAGPVRGLYIISKLKLSAIEGGPLPSRQGRGWLMCDVEKEDTVIRLATCHLESPLEAGSAREKQIQVFKKEFAGSKHAIFLGDFNFGDGENENKKLQDWVDVWTKLYPSKLGLTWNMEKNPMALKGAFPKEKSRRLDRIFIRGLSSAKITIIGDEAVAGSKVVFPSDHFGLVAELNLEKAEGKKRKNRRD